MDLMALPKFAELVKEVRDLAELRNEEHQGLLAAIGALADQVRELEEKYAHPLLRVDRDGVTVLPEPGFGDHPWPHQDYCTECGSLFTAGHFDSCSLYTEDPSAEVATVPAND